MTVLREPRPHGDPLRSTAGPGVVVRSGEFETPDLAEVYDTEYGWRSDDDHVLEFVTREPAAAWPTWVAGPGGSPSRSQQPAMRWWESTRQLPRSTAPVSAPVERRSAGSTTRPAACRRRRSTAWVMTAHVAQFLIADDEWRETAAIQASLFPVGRLYFDSRDP